ncbi:MAG TPA: nuclear transport factor 2 family protein [Kribbella sp.]|nr:nuclear transport factor 2 family protein [Kribbella sp.]
MKGAAEISPAEFVEEFFTSFTREILAGADEAAAVVDRYYTPDVVQVADGIALDRARLIDHLRPVRKNVVGCRYEVHEALRSGNRIAARFTIHAEMRKGRRLSTEVYLFGEVSPDGRIRRTVQATRAATEEPA